MRRIFLAICLLISITVTAQTPNPRPITLVEYQKAKTFAVKDLDNDTYVKFENVYILDRYEAKKPYFITGDDGLKKRMDLYKLIAKENMQELGLMIFYTNESKKQYQALLPNFTADSKVWETYFEDIHAIDKVEKNFVLKLSYVLSKELSFQQFKGINGGKDIKDEHATYGNDICFPGDQLVSMANGSSKYLKDVVSGDALITIDEVNQQPKLTIVKELISHEAKNYALTQLLLISATEQNTKLGKEVSLSARQLTATPNHPMSTQNGNKRMGDIVEGENVLCLNSKTGRYEPFTVLRKSEGGAGVQSVYSINAETGSTLLMNGVMVRQK